MKFIHFCICLIFISAAGTLYAAQKESYEDYSADEITRDAPLSDVTTSDDRIYKNLRGSIRDEIDETMSRERKEKEQGIDSGRINRDVRKIVREEISSASGTASKKYLRKWTFEFGGSVDFSTFFDHTESHKDYDDAEETPEGKKLYVLNRDKYVTGNPFINVFLFKNIAASVDSVINYNVTRNKFRYSIGAGPLFVFGLNSAETVCFFAGVSLGYHYDRDATVKYDGLLYSNKAGLKFTVSPGMIINCGIMGTVRSKGIKFDDFYMELNPFVGFSTWL